MQHPTDARPIGVPPIVRAAISALDYFGAITQHQARTLIGLWARRDELSDADVEQVVAAYPAGLSVDAYLYERDDDEPGGTAALPTQAAGWPVTGRAVRP